MAKKPRRLFMDDGSSHGTVTLNWRGKPLEEFRHMAEVFLDAANDATKRLKRNKHFGVHGIPAEDFRAYPVVYLYRHALELSMKAILIFGTKMLALKGQPEVDQEKMLSRHELDWLQSECERVFAIYGWGWDTGNKHGLSVGDLREIIGEFQEVDKRSFAFRYPVTRKGEASLERGFRFNLFRFADVLNGLFPTLIGAAIGTRDEYEDTIQAMGEAQEEARQYPDDHYEPPDWEPYD